MKKLILMIPILFSAYALADSAGVYGAGDEAVTVETNLSASHNDLTVRLTVNKADGSGTATTSWKDASADPSGDGRDVLDTGEITAEGRTFRWKDGKFQEKKDGVWRNPRKQPKPKTSAGSSGFLPVGNNVGGLPASVTIP